MKMRSDQRSVKVAHNLLEIGKEGQNELIILVESTSLLYYSDDCEGM